MNWKRHLAHAWHPGQIIAFSGLDGPTSYADGLVARTTVSPAGVEIMDPGSCKITFVSAPTEGIHFGADHFRFESAAGPVLGAMLDAHHLLISGECGIISQGEIIEVLQGSGRTLVGTKAKFDPQLLHADLDDAFAQRNRWLQKQDLPEELSAATGYALTRALTMMKSQVYSPEGAVRHRWTTPDRWPHKDMWLWDSAFHAIGWRHLDPAFAREMINAVFDIQQPDGFIPHRLSPAGAVSVFTQPPILAYGIKLVQETAPDANWLRQVYPKLEAYIEWDLAHRDSDGGGLAEWYIEEHPECRSGESGMDNSPRFDAAVPLDAVDFNAFLALECEVLAEFATQLGQPEDAAKWTAKHQHLCALINERLWSEEEQFYCDYNPAQGQRTTVLSSAGFLPLICGAATPAQLQALLRHLADPTMFATAVPIPSIAVRDTEHYSKDMWRGPMWVNINWFIARGLERYGCNAEAAALKAATVAEVERTCDKYGTFFEYFDDRREVEPPQLLRKGICAPELNPYRQVMHEFGWTATLYVDLILEKKAGAK